MQRSPIGRVFWACIAALLLALAASSPISAQEQITICHRTGSASNPWVFMTIDARLWPEYEAQGDKRATSLAECAEPQPTATAVATQQPVAQSTPVPTSTLAPPTPVPTPVRTIEANPAPTVEVAGATAEQASPDVSSLPKSGGEPDRPLLVLGLFVLAALGVGLRRFTRGSS